MTQVSSANHFQSSTNLQRIGVIGGGQLAGMMATAAQSLGIELVVQTPEATDPAVELAFDSILADLTDLAATAQLAAKCDVITFENEFVDLASLSTLAAQGVCFQPSLESLTPLLDKHTQRSYLQQLGLPVPQFTQLHPDFNPSSFKEFPLVVKARRHGYDGQGTYIVQNQAEWSALWQQFQAQNSNPADFLVEKFVPFERELAVIAARSSQGELALYPVVETQQEHQVCHRVIVPAQLNSSIYSQIEAIAHKLLESLQAVGVFGIELFLTPAGEVLVNEIAPRTHNSGHFSLDACQTSQFEQHLRAISGRSLENPSLQTSGAVMVNLLGFEDSQASYLDKREQLAAIPDAFVHWYGKTRSYPGRKLGHVTVLLASSQRQAALAVADKIKAIWSSS